MSEPDWVVCEDKMKCMACGLHFIIYSDEQPDRNAQSVYCPECGMRGPSIRLSQVRHQGRFIFQFVNA